MVNKSLVITLIATMGVVSKISGSLVGAGVGAGTGLLAAGAKAVSDIEQWVKGVFS